MLMSSSEMRSRIKRQLDTNRWDEWLMSMMLELFQNNDTVQLKYDSDAIVILGPMDNSYRPSVALLIINLVQSGYNVTNDNDNRVLKVSLE